MPYNLREKTISSPQEDDFIEEIISSKGSEGEVSFKTKIAFKELILSQIENDFKDTTSSPEVLDCLIKASQYTPPQNGALEI